MPRRTIIGDGKKTPLNMRTTAELRSKIERAAGRSGRSLVGEVEHRLELSFARDDFKRQLSEVVLVVLEKGGTADAARLHNGRPGRRGPLRADRRGD
jgi:hypothetical protein